MSSILVEANPCRENSASAESRIFSARTSGASRTRLVVA